MFAQSTEFDAIVRNGSAIFVETDVMEVDQVGLQVRNDSRALRVVMGVHLGGKSTNT